MKNEKHYYVYILANKKRGTLYIGVTNNISKRILEHRNKLNKDGFTAKYSVFQLVFCEKYGNIGKAIYREKQLKNWRRQWKVDLIEMDNFDWNDLSREWC